jgi:hypothetical protein
MTDCGIALCKHRRPKLLNEEGIKASGYLCFLSPPSPAIIVLKLPSQPHLKKSIDKLLTMDFIAASPVIKGKQPAYMPVTMAQSSSYSSASSGSTSENEDDAYFSDVSSVT